MEMGKVFGAAAASAQNILAKASGGTLLVVVLEEFTVRGILVRKKLKGDFEVVRYLDVMFEHSMDSPRLKLAHLFKQWGKVDANRALVVTNEFISTQAELPRPKKVNRFNRYKAEATFKALAQFEIAPFLDYSVNQAMVSVYVPPTPKGEYEDFGIDESDTVNATIFSMQRRTYDLINQVCKSVSLKLVGVMPEEIFAFSHCTSGVTGIDACLLEGDDLKPRILVNWRGSDAIVALLVNNSPISFQQEFFQVDRPPLESLMALVERTTFDYADVLTDSPKVILGGESAEKDWESSLSEIAPDAKVSRWDIAADLPAMESLGKVPARYMTAATAAFHATRKEQSSLLINDYTPITSRIVRHPLALPILVLFMAIGLLGLDAAWLEYKIHDMKAVVADVEQQKKDLDAEVKKGDAANKKYSDTKASIRSAEDKIDLIEKGLRAKQFSLQAFFAGLIKATPPSIQLNSVRQFSDRMWTIEGSGQRYDIISWYVVELKNLPNVQQCRLEKANQVAASNAKDKSNTGILYSFTLQVILEED
ncbi:MAG: PilN domain-containing protein [Pseudomonadota bacterium]